ncbi:type IV toxin-antitoxin system AbiEi family antitoxin [Nioella aestuarii]|uniref:type IV toxin-antitoxin system AbiEi family antitoxin n=1 Tax=Nioella aestuarii TaxID=1662864 RepID=UPI003D7F3C4A
MLLAKSISNGARKLLQEQQVAYYDLSGSLHICVEGLLILIDKPKTRTAKKRDINLFRGSRARVLHALFSRVGEWVTGAEIAQESGVSTATVSQTFKELERRDWLDAKGSGPAKRRRLSSPADLLDSWREAILSGPTVKPERYYVPRKKPEELSLELVHAASEENAEIELTGQFAAQAYAPFLSSVSEVSARIPDKRAAERVLNQLGARKVSEGANLFLLPCEKSGYPTRLENEVNGLPLASALQVYLDLLKEHGRSKEMADHLRSQELVWR